MNAWIAVASLALLSACGGPGAGPRHAVGTLSGHVYSSPSCPVERANSPCPPRLVPGAKIDLTPDAGGAPVVATAGAAGEYSISLPPGTYSVKIEVGRPMIDGPRIISLGSGDHVTADFTVDSGIR
ncbi:MAG: carboxypeptidase-like regulatory domain-containing protein [Candidatus Dormibacteraceae bacterium]